MNKSNLDDFLILETWLKLDFE